LIWEICGRHTLVHTFLGSNSVDYNIFYRSSIWDVAFNTDGTEVTSIAFDGTLRRWDLSTNTLIVDTQLADTIFEAKFDSTASQLAYTELGQTAPTIIDAIPPSSSQSISRQLLVYQIVKSGDGKVIAVTYNDYGVGSIH
jgi:WD40 repeat protein